jgi:hypothetical protein
MCYKRDCVINNFRVNNAKQEQLIKPAVPIYSF